MLEGIVIILHFLTNTGIKSSAEGQRVGNLTQFSTPMYPDCQCCVQGTGAAWSAASTVTPSHHKTSSCLGGAFPSGKMKYLEFTKSVWKTSCCIPRSCSGNKWHSWSSLTKQHISPSPCKKICCSVLATSPEPEVYLQKFIPRNLSPWYIQGMSATETLKECASELLLHHSAA